MKMYSKEVQLAISLFEAIDDVNMSNVIILLEKYNADPNVIIPKLKIAPLHFAIGFEEVSFAEEVTSIFLKKQANPNLLTECDSKLSPLHIACIWGRTKIVKMLLNAGGDLNLKCSEGYTPTLYAVQESNYQIIDLIKKFVFEQKIEKKKKELAAQKNENFFTPKKGSNLENNAIKKTPTTTLQNLEQNKFTPNRINYNFDCTSPYYINITHRRHKTSHNNYEKPLEKAYNEEKKNLFELTEKNLKEFSKQMNNAIVVERIAIHKRRSYIADWREKIQKIRKSDKFLDLSNVDYLNACQNTTIMYREDDESTDEISEESNDNNKVEIKSSSDYITASSSKSNLQRKENSIREEKSDDYIEKYQENYIHSDAENNIVLYERKIISNSKENLHAINDCAIGNSSVSSVDVTLPPLDYDTDTLRKELTHYYGDNPIINKHTKKLYLKKLVKIKKYPERLGVIQENNSRITYPLELQRTVTNFDYLEENLSEYLKLESRMVNHFREKNNFKWREGNSKTSFIYLLLDPRLTDNLPILHKELSKSEVWQKFLKAIFYVGKGKSSRPYHHLYDAVKMYSNGNNIICEKSNGKLGQNKNIESKKLNRIVEIWKDNCGIVPVFAFHNIKPCEAYTREASIIETLGIHNLTNMKKGDYYGAATAYNMRQKRQMGIALLHRALNVYLAEGESQMKPDDF